MKKSNFGLKQGGFTLIELLVVIVIIGILATIAIASFSGYFARARDAERATNIRSVDTILKTAFAVENITNYTAANAGVVDGWLNTNGGFLLADDATFDYTYVYSAEDTNQFGIYICSENDPGTVFAAGTSGILSVIRTEEANICATTPVTTGLTADFNNDSTNVAFTLVDMD